MVQRCLRILYFSSRECWPANSGARLRDFYLARALARRASLTYLGFNRGGRATDPPLRTRLEQLGNVDYVLVHRPGAYSIPNIVRGLAGRVPVTVWNFAASNMRAELRRLLAEHSYDLVQMEGVHLFLYVPLIRAAASHPKLVCDWHNIESELMLRYSANTTNVPKRLYAARTARMLQRLEQELLEECDAHVVCSERERQNLLQRAPAACIRVIENGVDVDSLAEPASHSALGPIERRRDLVFVGSMDYHANIDAVSYFVSGVWPQLHARQPELRFWIVGSRPAPEVLALGKHPGVNVTGTVEDVRPYYRGALAAVVPLRVGSGTRLKVLEAMAAGVPVVSTRLGIEGLDVAPGSDLLLADSPDELVAAITHLAGSDELWQRLASCSSQAVRARYDWPRLGESLFEFYSGLLGAGARL